MDIKQTMKKWIKDELELEQEPSDTEQADDLGLDSLDAQELVMFLEDELGVTLDNLDIGKSDTIQEISDKIQEIVQG